MSFTARLRSALRGLPAFLALGLLALTATAAEYTRPFNIPAGKAEVTLKQFAEQSGTQFFYSAGKVAGARTNAVKGELTPREALDEMLTRTELVAVQDEKTGAYTIKRESSVEQAEKNAPSRPASDRAASEEPKIVELPTFEVMGSKSLNMDIRRSRDDVQPYVIFDREKIEQSGATNLEDFLKQRLTMNTAAITNSQQAAALAGNTNRISLRGLGANQTLILIDGHRAPNVQNSGAFAPAGQPDINSIPMAAIDRVEILPTTASGIYGGSATGGVVNIILRRDYSGAELTVTYDNTFETDSAIRRLDFAAGFTLENGKTNILLAASYSDQNELWVQDRDLVQNARAAILRNIGGNPTTLAGTFPLIGASVNIRSANGSPLFGPGTSSITYVPAGYTGGLAPLQANAGKFDLALVNTAQSSAGGGGGGHQSLGSVPRIESFGATIRRQFSPDIQAFLEIAGANNTSRAWTTNLATTGNTIAASAPNNPFGQAILVAVPTGAADSPQIVTSYSRRAVGGLLFKLPGQWQGEVDYTWSRSRADFLRSLRLSAAGATAISNGALNVLRDPSQIDFTPYLDFGGYTLANYSTLNNGVARLSGPLMELPAGPASLSGLVEYRDERIGDGYEFTPTSATFSPARSQSLGAAYLETKIPVVSARNARPGITELEFQLAGRYDDYTLNGANTLNNLTSSIPPTAPIVRIKTRRNSTSPTVGVRYVPVSSLALRASYGTGFLPPTLYQLTSNVPLASVAGALVDPRRGSSPLTAGFLVTSGGSPTIRPEESESWSAGAIFSPKSVPGLRLSLDYTNIEKSDNIATLGVQGILDNEATVPERVTRGSNLPGDPAGWAGPVVAVNNTSVNMSSAWLEAWDLALDYNRKTETIGEFDFFAAATWQPHFKTQLAPTGPIIENAGTGASLAFSIPLKFKANAGLTWKYHQWTFGWVGRTFDSYLVVHPTVGGSATTYQRQGSTRVSSQTYHDVFAVYRFGGAERSGWLRNTEIRCGIRNIFNAAPPLDVANTMSLYSGLGDPRQASYYVSVKRAF